MSKKPYTQAQKEELRRLKENGATIEELMEHFGKTKRSITVTLTNMGLHKKVIHKSTRVTRKHLLTELEAEIQELLPEKKVKFITEKLTKIEDFKLILEGVRRLG